MILDFVTLDREVVKAGQYRPPRLFHSTGYVTKTTYSRLETIRVTSKRGSLKDRLFCKVYPASDSFTSFFRLIGQVLVKPQRLRCSRRTGTRRYVSRITNFEFIPLTLLFLIF